MSMRFFWYIIIGCAFYIGIIPGMIATVCAYFSAQYFYEAFPIALFVDVWYIHTFPYTLSIVFACVLLRKIVTPYIRI